MKKSINLLSLIFALFTVSAWPNDIYDQLPENIDPEKSYVFYSHGYIVEGDNPKPVDKRFGWGLYDFPAIKQALSDDSYVLVATHRPKDTDPYKYATELNFQVRTLVKHGVHPGRITLVGFSRGAFITGLTSDKLSDLEVNTVIMAGCGRLVSDRHTDIKVYGHVLSVFEKSDRANTCMKLRDKSRNLLSFEEIQLDTNLEHGAFYRPIPDWVNPVKQWIKAKHDMRRQ